MMISGLSIAAWFVIFVVVLVFVLQICRFCPYRYSHEFHHLDSQLVHYAVAIPFITNV